MGEQQGLPAELVLVHDLVNTLEVDENREELGSPDDLRRWLQDHDLGGSSLEVSSADLELTRTLRELLRSVLRANHGSPVDRDALALLNSVAAELPLRLTFTNEAEPTLGAAASGVRGALSRILGDVARAKERGTWDRLKVCSADDCQWAFYDRSKNRSGRWCSMRVCGNLNKTRAYRERKRADRSDSS